MEDTVKFDKDLIARSDIDALTTHLDILHLDSEKDAQAPIVGDLTGPSVEDVTSGTNRR